MYTFFIFTILWFIISVFRIKSNKSWREFNPFNRTVIDWFGFCFGLTILFMLFIFICGTGILP